MQPNNMVNQPVRPVARVQSAGPTFDNGPSIVKEKGSKKTGWIFGIVLCLILAAGGIGFGVWAWMDGKTQVDDLNGKISTLEGQNSALQNENATLKEKIEAYESATSHNARVTTVEIDETKLLDRDGAKAEIIDGKFYVKDSNGEEIIHDDVTNVTEIISCKSEPIGDSMSLVCEVMTSYGQGKFVYTYGQGYDVLNYTLDSWTDEILNNVDVEEVSDGVYVLDSK